MKEISGNFLVEIYRIAKKKYGENFIWTLEDKNVYCYTYEEFLNYFQNCYQSLVYFNYMKEKEKIGSTRVEWEFYWQHAEDAVRIWDNSRKNPDDYLDVVVSVFNEAKEIYEDRIFILNKQERLILEID